MFVARMVRGPAHLESIEEMDRELTKVIEDFDRAVDVEALRLAKKNGKHSLSQSAGDRSFSVASCRARVLAETA
jgi:hypothetical protein